MWALPIEPIERNPVRDLAGQLPYGFSLHCSKFVVSWMPRSAMEDWVSRGVRHSNFSVKSYHGSGYPRSGFRSMPDEAAALSQRPSLASGRLAKGHGPSAVTSGLPCEHTSTTFHSTTTLQASPAATSAMVWWSKTPAPAARIHNGVPGEYRRSENTALGRALIEAKDRNIVT